MYEDGAISQRCNQEKGYNQRNRGINDRDENCREDANKAKSDEVAKTCGNRWGNIICIRVNFHVEGMRDLMDIPGFREYLRQKRTRVHMKEPNRRLKRYADDIEAQIATTNPSTTTLIMLPLNLQSNETYLMSLELRLWSLRAHFGYGH